MTRRLSDATLHRLSPAVARPAYDRAALGRGVVHLGIGAFHRAHQAPIYDELAAGGDLRWGVVGVTMRSPAVRDDLAPQDGLYAMSVHDGRAVSDRVIGAVRGVLSAPQDPASVIAAIAAPDAHMITLTVTEKGYRLDPASGRLNRQDPEIAADLTNPERPRTAAGLIAAGLARRRRETGVPMTVASCDNLPNNGALLRGAVLEMASAQDPDLADWIEARCAFPQSMVDRIVPATEAVDLEVFQARAGLRDEGLVRTEPFSQWVIQDRFAGQRPDLTRAGVQVVRDVAPWEEAKLRLLNGAHSAVAYLGGLAGLTFVHQFVERPEGSAFIRRLWDESQTTLTPTPGLDLAAYRRDLMVRFGNQALQHRTRQIAMDGSQKLPQRLLAPVGERLEQNLPIEALALAIAAWIRWLGGRDDAGAAVSLDDPLAGRLRVAVSGAEAGERVRGVLSLEAVFPRPLAQDRRLEDALTRHLSRLDQVGVMAALGAPN